MDVELEFVKKCRVSLSPKTVLPFAPKSSSFHIENSKQRIDQSLVVEECSSNDIKFECYRSASCRSIPSASRLSMVDGPGEVKRGSVYQDSREVRKMKRMGDGASRRKIEISRTSVHKNADGKREKCCQDLQVHPELIRSSRSKLDGEACSLDGFIDFEVDRNDDRRREFIKGLYGDLSHLVEDVNGPTNPGNIQLEEDEVHAEFEEKLETLQTYSDCETIVTPESRTSSKSSSSRFSPIKKMMDPFLKSKSHKNPLSFEANGLNDGNNRCGKSGNVTMPYPVPCNFLDMKENVSGVQESPALLKACLMLKTKDETPLFEFMMKSPEINFLARIWKRNSNAGDWVYTIQSVNARKRRDFRGWGSNEDCKDVPVIGQMQVASRLCPESNDIADKSMVMEFVLYDLANTVNSKSLHDNSESTLDTSQLLKVPEGRNRNQGLATLAFPWEPATLHSHLETAAIIIQRRESLKFNKRVDAENDESLLCINSVRHSAPFDSVDVPEVVVVTPAGSHSLPVAENQGPSSLLDRWRLGGGCECGGWDMGCPLSVFSNPAIRRYPISHKENTNHVELLVQGERCKTSALSIKVIEEGKYDVTFHARLSALQAFSISVAMLHGKETLLIQKTKNSNPTTQCSPLKQLIEHELELLMEAFPKEESKQIRSPNRESHLSFPVNPPFSPISRA